MKKLLLILFIPSLSLANEATNKTIEAISQTKYMKKNIKVLEKNISNKVPKEIQFISVAFQKEFDINVSENQKLIINPNEQKIIYNFSIGF